MLFRESRRKLRRKVRSIMTVGRPSFRMGIALVALLMIVAPLPAFSQSCALCYTQAASAGARSPANSRVSFPSPASRSMRASVSF